MASLVKHVLFFLIDDLGFGDLGYKAELYNLSGSIFPTPFLDSLASKGIKLESFYTNYLCSPSRTGILSGRHSYNTGGNAEVIVNGQPDQLPTNIKTIADMLSANGWNTSAYGKWDLGMTTWGCTPLCRGFQHFSGFYNAFNDYFTHRVGDGLDLHLDFSPDANQTGLYETELITSRVQQWITNQVATNPGSPTFAFVAHQAIHAPQQITERYLSGGCEKFPDSNLVRKIACGQMAAVDESMANISATYKALGIWDDTLIIFTGDNGANPDTGGSSYPLRGMKATLFEGGMRPAAFVSGAGLSPGVRGTVSHEFYSHLDLLPMLVGGVAGIDLRQALLPKYPYQPPPPPLDGYDIWESLSTGSPSPRTEGLLTLDPLSCFKPEVYECLIPGNAAYRAGRWKLIYGHTGQYAGPGNISSDFCGPSDSQLRPLYPESYNESLTRNTTPPFCPAGWVPPSPLLPQPPPDAPECNPGGGGGLPCTLNPKSPYLTGGTWLFDVVSDPEERFDLALKHPDIVSTLLAKLQAINATRVPQSNSPYDPRSDPSLWGGVWTPWEGDKNPLHCDPNATRPA